MAGFPAPRRRINPALRDAVRSSALPGYQLALALGLHHSKLSELINRETLPATHANVERLGQIADAVGLDRSAIFIDADGRA